ncbi:hypothetical protein [Chondrinema litorale]|uniref:hypothetical protein n=1 Tax=Chondrinema litorale TaxID=2994555 RepID=UPI0025427185|nr:hypothetical protein [Chondrinema litorale]UZR95684.1 hypothetical protein OQ292_07655 [Chondrinema litorale]
MKIYIFLLFILFTISQEVFACKCFWPTGKIDLPFVEMGWATSERERDINDDNIIFTGALVDTSYIKVKTQDIFFKDIELIQLQLTFKVKKLYKGVRQLSAIDTFKILTAPTSSSCGFIPPLNSENIIFAWEQHGYYYTRRSDCSKSISKYWNEKRYNKYIKFLEVMINKPDGEYEFYQAKDNYLNEALEEDQLMAKFKIVNGKLEGEWLVKDKEGEHS